MRALAEDKYRSLFLDRSFEGFSAKGEVLELQWMRFVAVLLNMFRVIRIGRLRNARFPLHGWMIEAVTTRRRRRDRNREDYLTR